MSRFQLLAIPLAKGIMLTASIVIVIGVPTAVLALFLAVESPLDFGAGVLAGCLAAFALWWSWLILYDTTDAAPGQARSFQSLPPHPRPPEIAQAREAPDPNWSERLAE